VQFITEDGVEQKLGTDADDVGQWDAHRRSDPEAT
jgi:hypothetical protein